MDSDVFILANALVAKFDEASRFVSQKLLIDDSAATGHATMAMYPVHRSILPVPDPVKDEAQWGELTFYLKEKRNISAAVVLREGGRYLLMVNAPLKFNLCMQDETVWMPWVVEACQDMMRENDNVVADLFDRLTKH